MPSIDADATEFAVQGRREQQLLFREDRAELAGKSRPAIRAPAAAVAKLTIDHEADNLRAAIDDRHEVVPLVRLQQTGVAVPRRLCLDGIFAPRRAESA